MEGRLNPLTSLRFFAALGIVLFHCQSLGLKVPSYAAQGVSFFFVLSGFILTYVHPQVPSLPRFYQKRVARIWPVHLLGFAISATLQSAWPAATIVVANLFLLHAWVPAGEFVFSFNAVSWSVSDELFFYLLFPLMVGSRRMGAWLLGSGVLTLAIVVAANRLWSTPLGTTGFGWMHILLQHPPTRLFEFVVGAGLGRYFLAGSGRPPGFLARWPTLVEIGAIALVAAGMIATLPVAVSLNKPAGGWLLGPGAATWWLQMGALPAFAVAILVFAHGRGRVSRLLSLPLLVLLGEISYSTYMLHQLVLAVAERHRAVEFLGLPLAVLVVLVATYAASYLSWRWLEKPARSALAGLRLPSRTPGGPANR